MRIFLLAVSGLVLAACSGANEHANPAPQSGGASEAATETDGADASSSTKETNPADTDTAAQTNTAEAGDWFDSPPPNAYGDGWDVDWGWGGEYPAGFSVIQQNTSVPVRANPDPAAPQTGTCDVEYRGVYQPWNQTRSEKIEAYYLTATQMVDYTLTKPQELTFWSLEGGDEVKQDFAAGDKVTFKRYLGEGMGHVIVDGTVYETDLMAFYETATSSVEDPQTHDWLSMMCNGKRVWMLYDDAIAQDGIVHWTPQGWGEAADLTDAELDFELNLDRSVLQ